MILKLESEVRKAESGVPSGLDISKVNKDNQVYERFWDFSMRTPFNVLKVGVKRLMVKAKVCVWEYG